MKAVVVVSLMQGCPRWRGIWRKQAANLRSEEHELHIRLGIIGWVCETKQSPYCRRWYRV